MVGNDQVRFCDHCSLEVHNISLLTRRQAERLLARSDEDAKDALAHAAENDHAAVVRFLKSKGALETIAKVEKEQ